ncbi:MAG: hypothetical protein AAB972_00810, partial [Patescibacteria group bacterium]
MMIVRQQLTRITDAVRQRHIIAFIFITSALLFSFGNIYDSDEGTILNGAWKMFQGNHLYTDFFAFVAPGSYILTLSSFYLFGPYYFSARILSIFVLALSLYAVYTIGVLLGGRRVATFAAALWMICSFIPAVVINYNPLSSYLASIATLLLIMALKKKSALFFACSGLVFGGVTVFLQTKGIILGLGFFIFLSVYMIRRIITPRHMIVFITSFALLPLSLIWYWGAPFLYQLFIEWPLRHYPTVNHISLIPWFVLLIASVAFMYGIWRHSKQDNKDIIIILITAHLCLFFSIINRPDIGHILWSSFAVLLLASYVIHAYTKSLSPAARDTMFIDIPLMIVLSFSIAFAINSIHVQRAFKKTVEKLSITSIYAHPFLPGLYFELGVPDPYPYDILLSHMYSYDAFNANLRILTKE